MSDELYHYTTMAGALAIIESQELHATHVSFLNDLSEGALAKKELEHIIYHAFADKMEENRQNLQIKIGTNLNDILEEEARNHLQILFDALHFEPYIASFCQKHQKDYAVKHGLLSQWRGYGKDGGVALVFNKKDLDIMIGHENDSYNYVKKYMSEVKYSDGSFLEIFSEEIEYIKEYSTKIFWGALTKTREEVKAELNQNTELSKNTINALLKCLFFFKHEAFSEETEFRIAMPVISPKHKHQKNYQKTGEKIRPSKPTHFHNSANGTKIPRIKLFDRDHEDSFFKKKGTFNETSILLPIKKIIIGPHKDKEERAILLKLWAKEKMGNDNNIKITVSEIPYIEK